MTPVVLDASALLTVLFKETGHEIVAEALAGEVIIPAVNYTEVLARQMRAGVSRDLAVSTLAGLDLKVVVWDQGLAEEAADLSPFAKSHGLALGDRICLATARHLRLPVLTADREWGKLPDLGVEIRVIR
ncbi:MAG: type II toxin-antitoxin system VapC family toxin [Bryobacteraceae bacterium]|nr:type II toxin-antitoxin system VapC family toxin [Bryobacteraceae bacterium]